MPRNPLPPGYCCCNRLFEWVMSAALFGLGIHVAIWPTAMGASSFRFILDLTGIHSLAVVYLMIGGFRMLALLANGSWPRYGPHVRAAAALAGGAMWLQMDIALAILIPEQGTPPSPGIPVYTALFFGELVATFRAARDAKYRNR